MKITKMAVYTLIHIGRWSILLGIFMCKMESCMQNKILRWKSDQYVLASQISNYGNGVLRSRFILAVHHLVGIAIRMDTLYRLATDIFGVCDKHTIWLLGRSIIFLANVYICAILGQHIYWQIKILLKHNSCFGFRWRLLWNGFYRALECVSR